MSLAKLDIDSSNIGFNNNTIGISVLNIPIIVESVGWTIVKTSLSIFGGIVAIRLLDGIGRVFLARYTIPTIEQARAAGDAVAAGLQTFNDQMETYQATKKSTKIAVIDA